MTITNFYRRFRSIVGRIIRRILPSRFVSPAVAPVPVVEHDTIEPYWTLPPDYFHQLLHELRTIQLEKLRVNGERVLSIGVSGRWYFEWFERSVGVVDEHIGIEAFETKPDDLPPYVTWNQSTADHFDGVDDNSVDLAFAGQTTEHLWASELTDFLIESHRVLRLGASLVLDSPNRLITEHLRWTHGGHTVELSADEITVLLELAGFEIESKTGVYLSRLDGVVLQLEEGLDRGDIAARRLQSDEGSLDDSFIWWVIAKKTAAAPDRAKLLSSVEKMFWSNWPTRICRGVLDGPHPGDVAIPAGTRGPVATTLEFPIAAGDWTLGLDLDGSLANVGGGLEIRILDESGDAIHVLGSADADQSDGRLTWEIRQPHLQFSCTLQLIACDSDSDIAVRMPIDLRATTGIGVRAIG